MKTMRAQWLTVHKSDIDHDTSIEILWQTAPNTLHALIFCIRRGSNGASLTSEEIGPYRCLADLRQRLCMLFGERAAQRICNPSSWLPPGIPVIRSEPLRPATRSHLAMTDVQQSEKIQPVSSHEHWTEVA
jgi:hypothetical protein